LDKKEDYLTIRIHLWINTCVAGKTVIPH